MEYVDRHNSDFVVSLTSCGVIIVLENRLQLTLSEACVEKNCIIKLKISLNNVMKRSASSRQKKQATDVPRTSVLLTKTEPCTCAD
jgi:hypothetical protein